LFCFIISDRNAVLLKGARDELHIVLTAPPPAFVDMCLADALVDCFDEFGTISPSCPGTQAKNEFIIVIQLQLVSFFNF